jgi:hypothetical protein
MAGRRGERRLPPRRVRSALRRSAPGWAAALAVAALAAGCALVAREATVAYMAVDSAASGGIKIDIYRSFIESYKDRVSIQATFTVDQSLKEPFPAFFDGDFHFAGRAPQIGFPTVCEIANAGSEPRAIDLVHRAETWHTPLKLSGVWRVWPEHAAVPEAKQGEPQPPVGTATPSHVFEIHPVIRLGRLSLLDSFRPVQGFRAGDAHAEFGLYDSVPCEIALHPSTVSIITRKGLYNDVEFLLEATTEPQQAVPDGRFLTANVRDLQGELVSKRRRMVLVLGSAPELAARRLRPGQRLHVWGIPRLSFAEIARRVAAAATRPAELAQPLPYEIIVIGLFDDRKQPG